MSNPSAKGPVDSKRAMQERADEAVRLLDALWPGETLAESGVKLAMWRPRKRTEFFDAKPALAARSVEIAAGGEDVYFSTCALRGDYAPPDGRHGARGTAADVRYAPALFVDLDVKIGAFTSVDAALRFLEGLPIRPTAAIKSGTGVHAWWIFKEPFDLGSSEGLAGFDSLSRGWLEFMRRAAGSHVTIDSTVDAARVLRLPGTVRVKGGPPILVEMAYLNDRRANPTDFLEYAVPVQARTAEIVTAESGLYLDPDAQPPLEKFVALSANEERFAASFARRDRKDIKDNSPSGHDMSLASLAVRAGWADQEMIDLIAAARRQHKDDQKPLDWYIRTVRKARAEYVSSQSEEAEQERREDFVARIAEAEAAPPGSETRKTAAVEAARRFTGVEIASLVRYIPEPYRYAIQVTHGARYLIGTASDLRSWDRWVDTAIDLKFRINPHRPKAAEWLRCVQLLSEFAEDKEQVEFSMQARCEALICSYLSTFGSSVVCSDAVERNERAFRRAPFAHDGYLYLSIPDLLADVERRGGGAQRLITHEDLYRLGFTTITVAAARPTGPGSAKSKQTTRKYQRAPLNRLPLVRQTVGIDDPDPELIAQLDLHGVELK
jgi:hypothetical protein